MPHGTGGNEHEIGEQRPAQRDHADALEGGQHSGWAKGGSITGARISDDVQ